jgi:hypothetical protein
MAPQEQWLRVREERCACRADHVRRKNLLTDHVFSDGVRSGAQKIHVFCLVVE